MKYLLLIILILLCIYPFFSLKKDKTKLYQLPCLFGMVTVGMIVSTLITNVINVNGLSEDAFNLYIVNACLCLICAYFGYSLPVKQISKAYQYNEKKMLFITSIFFFIGLYFYFLLGEFDYAERNEGWAAIFIVFARFTRPATIIMLFLLLRKYSIYKLLIVLLWLCISLFRIGVDGRRSEFFLLLFTIFLPLFFVKGYIPYKKRFLLIAIVSGISVYILLPVVRIYTLESFYRGTNSWNEIANINFSKELLLTLEGEKTNDILEATYTQYAIKETGEYNYGSDFYNRLVDQYASRTLFGEGTKEKLYINKIDLYSVRRKVNEWGDFRFYLTKTGFVDVFAMFGYFGCLMFFFFARISKRMWYDAIYTEDIMHKVFYSNFLIFICWAIYTSISWLIVALTHFLLVYLPIKYFSRVKNVSL